MRALRWTFPMLASHLTVLTPVEETPATAPHSRRGGEGAHYPMKPKACEHPEADMYRYGNASGKYKECRRCGAGWKQEGVWTNPVNTEEVPMWSTLPPRPRPGADRPKAETAGKAKAKPSQAPATSAAPSSSSRSRVQPSPPDSRQGRSRRTRKPSSEESYQRPEEYQIGSEQPWESEEATSHSTMSDA